MQRSKEQRGEAVGEMFQASSCEMNPELVHKPHGRERCLSSSLSYEHIFVKKGTLTQQTQKHCAIFYHFQTSLSCFIPASKSPNSFMSFFLFFFVSTSVNWKPIGLRWDVFCVMKGTTREQPACCRGGSSRLIGLGGISSSRRQTASCLRAAGWPASQAASL